MPVPDDTPRYRQYAGLALVIIAYVGGIIGWSCAVLQVEADSSSATNAPSPIHQRVLPSPADSSRSAAANPPHFSTRPIDGKGFTNER